MPVVLTQDIPVPIDVILQISAELNVANDPPPGLIVHVSVPRGDSTRVIDIWESRDDFERFAETRLGPAIAKVTEEAGIDMPGAPEPTIEDARDLVRGR